MPYIEQISRKAVDAVINSTLKFIDGTTHPGVLNYIITRIIHKAMGDKCNYRRYNELMGVLTCVSQEFYDRKVRPYEDEKIKENGDL
ncbi:hypothetical protein KKH23_07370 [Patescibacteria group bacterium]|nr:hypothetical protein [Patescibacteria group bacterium]